MADCLGVTLTASESQLIPTTSEAVIYLPISLLYPALQLTDELSDEVRSHLFENFAGELLTPWIAVDYPGSLVLTMEYFGENLNGELSPLRFCAKELAEFASTISPLNSNTVDTESTGTEELFGTPQRDNDGNLAIRTAGNALFRQSGEIPSAPEVKNYLVEHGLTKHGIDVEHGKHGDIVIEGRPISKDAFRTRYQRMLKRK
ncbi:hypothetical protein [Litorivicinus lipolyticus]|uniref:hypothetical protein n=1 Tax=Litorivicinus lipolyticus TaxID=418701 RepID=UPI003B592C85